MIKWVLAVNISDIDIVISQPAITCSKLTIETVEKCAKYVQS